MRIRLYALAILLLGSSVTYAHTGAFTSLQQNVFQYIGQPNSRSMDLPIFGGYRLYNSDIGQFLKQDAYSPFQGDRTLNGFNYAGGNPIFFIDRSGHVPREGKMYAPGPLRSLKGDLSVFPAYRQVASRQLSEKEQVDNLTEQVSRLTVQIDSLIRQKNRLTVQLCQQNALVDQLKSDRFELLGAYAAKSREYTQLVQQSQQVQQRWKGQQRRVAFGDQSVVELPE